MSILKSKGIPSYISALVYRQTVLAPLLLSKAEQRNKLTDF